MERKNIAILASGSGTNAEEIIKYFGGSNKIEVSLVLSNKPEAYVLKRAKKYQIPTHVFSGSELKEGEVLNLLIDNGIDFIVLAGFLLLIPTTLIKAFPDRIINIHPALLPKYGGKGMYGDNVHKAVRNSGDTETGISIHLVNERYDEGRILFQASCSVTREDTPEIIASKVHKLEHTHFPKVIEEYIESLN